MNKKIFVILLSIVLTLSACTFSNSDNSGSEYVYYLNETNTELVKVDYDIEYTNVINIVSELMEKMATPPEEVHYHSAIPEGIEKPEYEIEEDVIIFHFGQNYFDLSKTEEILYRAALVLTVTQLSEIKYVNIYVGDQPLVDSNDVPIVNLTSESFVDLSGDTLELKREVTFYLYLPTSNGEMLREETYQGTIDSDKSFEEEVLAQLSGIAFPEDVEIYSVITRNKICYIDFSKEYIMSYLDIEDEVAIYSIVNSLCELPYISKVKINVDDNSSARFHDNIVLDQKFLSNLNYVQY